MEEEEAAKTSHPLIFIKHPLTVRGSPGDNSPAFPFARQMAPFSPTAEKKKRKKGRKKKKKKIETFAGSSPLISSHRSRGVNWLKLTRGGKGSGIEKTREFFSRERLTRATCLGS